MTPNSAVLVLAQPRVVDPAEHQRQQQPDAGEDRLALDVVQRMAGTACAVAPLSVTSEQATSPSAASSSSGSISGSAARDGAPARLLGRLDRRRAHSVVRVPADVRRRACRRTTATGSGARPARRRRRRSRPARRGRRPRSACWSRCRARSTRTRRSRAGRGVLRGAGLAVDLLGEVAHHVSRGAARLRGGRRAGPGGSSPGRSG